VFFAVLLLLLPITTAHATGDPIATTDCSYGDVYQFAPAGCRALISNRGAAPVTLTISSVQPEAKADPAKITLVPGERAEIALSVPTDNIAGAITWTYRIDGAGKEDRFLHASGFVSSIVDVGHPEINFGDVDSAALPVLQTARLVSSVDPKMRVTQIVSSPPMLHAQIGTDEKSVSARLDTDSMWGSFDDLIKLATDNAQQAQIWVQVTGRVAGDVGPSTNPRWLGEITRRPNLVLSVPLIDRAGKDFLIGPVVSADFAATYDSGPCEPVRAGCRNLVIHVSESQPAGLFKSHLDVALPDRGKHLMVAIWGVLGERPEAGKTAQPPVTTKIPVTVGEDSVSAIPPMKTQPDPDGEGPLLKWTVAQQQSVYGFQVFRSVSPEGPFAVLNSDIIPKLDNGRGPVAYRWRDTSAVKGQTYWYYVAVLYTSGDRRPLSSPQKTLAK
jgi:hypothetical protein